MNRYSAFPLALLTAAMPMVLDSAFKGAALLAMASVAALALWRASAAARHLVWLVAVLALLLVPVLSVVLPGWRVLPDWAVTAAVTKETEMTEGTILPMPGPSLPEAAALRQMVAETSPHAAASPRPPSRDIPLVSSVPLIPPALASQSTASWLPLAWSAGCLLLLLRLFSAHWLLRRASRHCQVTPEGRLTSAMAEAAQQLGVRQRIRFLLDEKRTIPVVWGVIWLRLILPAEALSWDDAKLRSVLLHELAHIRRRDTLVQWLTQLACALHWFNPLVWLAAWRLHTERERACDDLVLASGVKASAYAGHLLDVASKLTPARWTSACGLAMARKSSLESRLRAVLSGNLNRRGVTGLLAFAAVLLTAAVVVPLAMLRAAETEKPKFSETHVNEEPKTAASQSLFNHWKRSARTDGKISGGCIGQVAASLKTYMDLNAGTDYATKCEAVFKKCDATHDWTPADAVALLDEIETVAKDHAAWTMRAINERQIHSGKPLPDELKDAPWGTPAINGLRMAWLCGTGVPPVSPETGAKDESNKNKGGVMADGRDAHATLNSILTSRILFHNTGKAAVCFATEDWIQLGSHAAKDAMGKDIPIHATSRMGIRTRMIFRLAPGEYAEVVGHGIGIGSHEAAKETDIRKVGAWIEAKEGDEVTFTPGKLLVSFQTWQNNEGRKDSETVWQEIISARLAQEGPNPASERDRAALLARVSADLGIALPYDEAKFTYENDPFPDAFERLTKRFQEAAKPMHFAGELSGGGTKFTVTTKAKDKSAKSDRSQESHRSYSDQPSPPTPKHEYAQALFKRWQTYARADGKIPGALIGHVAEQMDSLLKQHPTDSKAAALAAVRPRLDATHDWTPEDVVKLMDDITGISTAPLSWAGTTMEFAQMNKLLPGKPLPEELQKVNWGKPAANGLRSSYLLDPSATEYPLNRILKAGVLFHNTGTTPIIFRTETWHQNDKHQASGVGVPPVSQEPSVTPKSVNQEGIISADGRDAHATPINVSSTWYTGMTPIATYRLAPGEYTEVPAHGIAIGAGKYEEEHSTGSVGAVIEATVGQTIRFSTEVNAINEGWTRPNDPKDPTELYLKNIADRIALEAPVPKSTADRELLIVRAMQDLFGQPPTEAEVAMFTTDVAPDALEKLTARLQAKPRPIVFSGNLQTGETTFKVLPADPNAAKAPRTAASPGRYVLGDNVHLQVTQTTEGDKRTNTATILFLSPDPKVASPHKPYEITLNDGGNAYAFAWVRGTSTLWIKEFCLLRKLDFTDPEKITEARYVGYDTTLAPIPNSLRETLRIVLPSPVAPKNIPATPKEKPSEREAVNLKESGIKLSPEFLIGRWRGKLDDQKIIFSFHRRPVEKDVQLDIYQGDATIGVIATIIFADDGSSASIALGRADSASFGTLLPAEAGTLKFKLEGRQTDQTEVMLTKDKDMEAVDPNQKLEAANLEGYWEGVKDGVKVEVSFQWLSEHQQVHWRVIREGSNISAQMSVVMDPEGKFAAFVFRKGVEFEATQGRIRWGENGLLLLDIIPNPNVRNPGYPEMNGLVLKRWIGRHARLLPRTEGSRSLFAKWKENADKDGKIPGAFLAQLGASVKLQTQNHLEQKWPHEVQVKLATPFISETAFTPEDAIFLLDEVAEISLDPINLILAGKVPGLLKPNDSTPSKSGQKINSAIEQKLKWGEPANGLRMALAWAPTSGEPALGAETEFYLVVQNVSDTLVHFLANADAPNPRKLTIRKDGKPLSALNDPTVMAGDWLLKPREVAFIKLFQPLENGDGKASVSATVEADVRAFPQYSLTAEMNIEKAPVGAWTGKLVTGETRGSMDVIPPQSKDVQALLKAWSNAMRMDGKIPGGLIGKLSESVQTFIKSNPTWATTPQLQALLPRLDASHDWSGQDAVSLLNELSALQETPIQMALEQETQHVIRTGTPLPAELAKAPWGETLANGLRHAWLLEPNAAEHSLGTALKARALIHNAGKEPVTFRTRSWHQLGHKATDANGKELKTESVDFMTRGILTTYRLAPGEFIEVNSPGIGLGKMMQVEKDGISVGTWIEAQAGDEVTISTKPIPLMDWNEDEQLKLDGEPRWWLDYIRARLARHLPFPDDQTARERLLYRVAMELFGTPVSEEINAAFVADKSPKALEALAELLFHRQGHQAWAGALQSGAVKFRVTAQTNRWIEIKPNQKCDIGNGLFAWITSAPVGNSFRNYLTIDGTLAKSSSGHAGLKVHDSCALPYGLGTGAVTIARDVIESESYRIAVASANGVDGLGFSIRGFEDHQNNWHLSPDLTSPRNYSSLRDVDETLREWARQIIPNLKPEYGIPPGPEFEFRLIAKDDEPAQIVRADAPPKVDDRPVPVRFYRLGKVLLTRADLEGNGGYGGDMCQAINYKVKDSAAGNFEAICKELNGREAVLIVKEKIRGKVKLAPGLQKISGVYSMNEMFRLFEIKPEPPSNQAAPTREDETEAQQ